MEVGGGGMTGVWGWNVTLMAQRDEHLAELVAFSFDRDAQATRCCESNLENVFLMVSLRDESLVPILFILKNWTLKKQNWLHEGN